MTTGLRERKKDATRRALIETAVQLALDRGYDRFTVAELADTVGVSRRTFSNYFDSKADCVVAGCEDWTDAILDAVSGVPATADLAEVLRTALRAMVTGFGDGQILALIHSEPELRTASRVGDEELISRIAAEVSARTGLPRDDIRVPLLAEFAILAGHACIERWATGGHAGDVDGLTSELDRAFSIINLSALRA